MFDLGEHGLDRRRPFLVEVLAVGRVELRDHRGGERDLLRLSTPAQELVDSGPGHVELRRPLGLVELAGLDSVEQLAERSWSSSAIWLSFLARPGAMKASTPAVLTLSSLQ